MVPVPSHPSHPIRMSILWGICTGRCTHTKWRMAHPYRIEIHILIPIFQDSLSVCRFVGWFVCWFVCLYVCLLALGCRLCSSRFVRLFVCVCMYVCMAALPREKGRLMSLMIIIMIVVFEVIDGVCIWAFMYALCYLERINK